MQGTATSHIVAAIELADSETPESQIIAAGINNVLAWFEVGSVDSHVVATAMFGRRKAGTWDQCRDYVQHLFREAAHVCRHADGHHYTVHSTPLCSVDCDTKFAQSRPQTRPVSACCFVEQTTTGLCPFGCDE